MLWFLQVSVALIFFSNKVLVLLEKKVGWLLGAIAAVYAVFYFYLIELWVYTALEFGLIALMGYGFFKKGTSSPKVEAVIRGVTITVMMALTMFAFRGLITLVELVSSLGLLAGTYLLTHGRKSQGWMFYAVAHSLAAVLGYEKGQQFFADFQVASAIISVIGISQARSPVAAKAS